MAASLMSRMIRIGRGSEHDVKLREGDETKWYEIFTGPKMFYRTALGVVLQAGQQLTGANFFVSLPIYTTASPC